MHEPPRNREVYVQLVAGHDWRFIVYKGVAEEDNAGCLAGDRLQSLTTSVVTPVSLAQDAMALKKLPMKPSCSEAGVQHIWRACLL